MVPIGQPHLMPMPEPFDGYVEKPAQVSSTCLVAVARNRYSMPCKLVGQIVSTLLYLGRVVIVAGVAIVASHERIGTLTSKILARQLLRQVFCSQMGVSLQH